jgi:hypothetical protein
MKRLIDLSNEEARSHFLKGSSYFNLDLPKYISLEPINLLGIRVDLLTPGDLPQRSREKVLLEARPVSAMMRRKHASTTMLAICWPYVGSGAAGAPVRVGCVQGRFSSGPPYPTGSRSQPDDDRRGGRVLCSGKRASRGYLRISRQAFLAPSLRLRRESLPVLIGTISVRL